MGAWRRGGKPKKPAAARPQSPTAEEREWMVAAQYCRGCRYYKSLGHSGSRIGGKFCGYTWMTGRIRHKPPRECEVKDTRPLKSTWEGE